MGKPATENKRAQTTLEYLFLAVGVIIFIVLVYVLLQGNIISKQSGAVQAGVSDFLLGSEYYLFFDNFDSDTANQWTALQQTWRVVNKEYVQDDTSDEQKIAYAGSSGWVNYYADTKVQFDSLSSLGILAGISARVNKNSGARYSCIFELTSTTPAEGVLKLMRYYDWEATEPDELNVSSTFGTDNSVHVLGIRVNGNDLGCYWDNVEKITYTDATPYKYGMLSLEQRLASTHFDTVRAKYQEGPTPSGATPIPPSPTATPEGGGDSPSPSPTPAGSHTECSRLSCIEVAGDGANQCETDLECQDIVPLGGCSDGTEQSSCSANQPYYCSRFGDLEPDCVQCGCPEEMPYCNTDSNCSSTPSTMFLFNTSIYNTTLTTAEMNWSTNIYGNGSIEYGIDTGYGEIASHAANLLAHSLKLAPLLPDTTYHYRITSCNATLCNSTSDANFSTLPLVHITNVVNDTLTQTTAWVRWDTNLYSNGSVQYGLTEAYGSVRTDAVYRLVHGVQLMSLTAGTVYHYKITSCNATLCTSTGDYTFKTLSVPSCSDSDAAYSSGRAPAEFGTVTTETNTYNDVCGIIMEPEGYSLQVENYCSGTTRIAGSANCEFCSGGECSGQYCMDVGSGVYTENGYYSDGCKVDMVPPTRFDYSCDGINFDSVNLGPCDIGDPLE